MARKLPTILSDKFTFKLNDTEVKVSLEITRYNDKATSGRYVIGRKTKNNPVIQFFLAKNARRPMIWVLTRNKGVTVTKTEERAIQAQATAIIFHWTDNRALITAPAALNHKELPKPEEGIYDPANQRIEVYFNINRSEMVHTIAHEFGHALDLPHNDNRLSIMFPYSTQTEFKITSG